jgi:tryptophanyl-tRNA synthetase
MSKSAPDAASRILLTDAPNAIVKKVKSAVTDSDPVITYDPVGRPGTANLLEILAAAESFTLSAAQAKTTTTMDMHALAARYANTGHGKLKSDVADAVVAMLDGPRREYEKLKGEDAYLRKIAEEGARKARERSRPVLEEVRKRVGLGW